MTRASVRRPIIIVTVCALLVGTLALMAEVKMVPTSSRPSASTARMSNSGRVVAQPLVSHDEGLAIAVDGRGNVYTVGAVDPAGGFLTEINSRDHIVVHRYLPGRVTAIALDRAGNIYVSGTTTSERFPTKHAVQRKNGGGSDAFVARFDHSGKLIYSSYLGGTTYDGATSIAVDQQGDAYVTGVTFSSNFPTLHPLHLVSGEGASGNQASSSHAFVTKLSPVGNLLFSTYLGGSGSDEAYGIAVDREGNTYVTGLTTSKDFPTVNPLQRMLRGPADAFVSKLSAAGSSLVYSTYLGGTGVERATGIAIDEKGNAYVTGFTASGDFPVTGMEGWKGGNDVFVSKLASTGDHLVYSTYLGGKQDDRGTGIALDRAGRAYVTGYTNSPDFPTAKGLQSSLAGGVCGDGDESRPCFDGFVAQLSPTGSHLLDSTYLGGKQDDLGNGVAVDRADNVYVIGSTSSVNFPTKNSLPGAHSTGADAFVVKLNLGSKQFSYSTYLNSNPGTVP